MLPEKNIDLLHEQIVSIIKTSKQATYRAVNSSMVLSYWEIGRVIFEEEQQGQERADYGKYLIVTLAQRLKGAYGSGYAQQSLRNYRQLYKSFPIRSALRSELTWTHYRTIMRVESSEARSFYVEEAIKCNWDTRSLERQIQTFYYQRRLSSNNPTALEQEAAEKTTPLSNSLRDFIKDPFVLEFLEVNPNTRFMKVIWNNSL